MSDGDDNSYKSDEFDNDDSNEFDLQMEVSENKRVEKNYFTILNTNARSICPKIGSFIDCFKEMDACLAVVTETWLQDGQQLQDDVDDLLHGAGLGLITRNRPPNSRGVSHGG